VGTVEQCKLVESVLASYHEIDAVHQKELSGEGFVQSITNNDSFQPVCLNLRACSNLD